MHDAIRDLSRGQTLDDLLAETEALAQEGARAGRRVYTAADLDAFAADAGAAVVDGTRGPRIVVPREPRIVRSITIEEADAAGPADYGATSPDAVIAREDARHGGFGGDLDQVPGSTYADLEECAAGRKRVRGTSGGDKGPKARRTGGAGSLAGPTKVSQENWDHERSVGGRPRKGRDVRERFSIRAEPETRATIAQTGRTESDFLAEAAKLVAMAQTGAQADELMRAVIALAGKQAAA